MESLRYKTAIVGASETTELGNIPDKTPFQLHVDASVNAIKDCGIDKQEIDGIATTMNPASLAHYLGITPKWIDNTQVGGTSFLIHVRHAAAAIASGLCETVLVSMAESGRSRVGDTSLSTFSEPTLEGMKDSSFPGQFESIYGVYGPTTQFGLGVLRYMKAVSYTHLTLPTICSV